MAPQTMKRKSGASEDYESDNGFVEDAPSSKKSKRHTTASSSSSRAKQALTAINGGGAMDEDGNAYWEISKMRRVTVTNFKGKDFINVREYYEKDDKELPGKKVRERHAASVFVAHCESRLI